MAKAGFNIFNIWRNIRYGTGFDRVLKNVNLLYVENGNCKAEMTVAEEHMNTFGGLHGGMTSTMIDVLSAIALSSYKNCCKLGVSVDLHVTFMRAPVLGEELVIEARTNRAGKTMAYVEVDVTNKKDGGLIAKALHSKFIARV